MVQLHAYSLKLVLKLIITGRDYWTDLLHCKSVLYPSTRPPHCMACTGHITSTTLHHVQMWSCAVPTLRTHSNYPAPAIGNFHSYIPSQFPFPVSVSSSSYFYFLLFHRVDAGIMSQYGFTCNYYSKNFRTRRPFSRCRCHYPATFPSKCVYCVVFFKV